MKHWQVIINPHTLNVRKEKLWARVKSILEPQGFAFSEHITVSGNQCEAIIASLLTAGNRLFVVVGGDGTLNEVLNAVMKHCSEPQQIVLALIPSGTGNDWSRTHHIPKEAEQLAQMFLSGKVIPHDVGYIEAQGENTTTGRYFINIAGFGFDAEVILRINRSVKMRYAGKFIYLKNLFLTLLHNKPNPCHFTLDGQKQFINLFSGVAGICRFNGGGMMQAPTADFNDGFFDVILIEPMNFWEILTQLPRMYKGAHVTYKKVHSFRVAHILIEPAKTMFAETEGEIVGKGPFVIKNAGQKIAVLVP